MSTKYFVETRTFELPNEVIPKNSLLDKLRTSSMETVKREDAFVPSLTSEEFEPVMNLLTLNKIPKPSELPIFDYLHIDPSTSYPLSLALETAMRKDMYNPEKASEYKDPYFGLIKLTEDLWEKIVIPKERDVNLLFDFMFPNKATWEKIQERLQMLPKYKNAFTAGGSIFSILFGERINDIDIFFYGISQEEAQEKIFSISKEIEKREMGSYKSATSGFSKFSLENLMYCDRDIKCMGVGRSPNSITFFTRIKLQVVLRLYQSPSEIIHGFDVDSCCMGYDGKDIWLTQRCLYSLMNGFNTVNFERLSPSYEARLVKYGKRGIAIKVPNFDKEKVKWEEIDDFFKKLKEVNSEERHIKNHEYNPRYRAILDLKGLDVLLYFHQYLSKKPKSKAISKAMDKLGEERSDYSNLPYSSYSRDRFSSLSDLLEKICCGGGKHGDLNISEEALKLLKKVSPEEDFSEYYGIYNTFFLNVGKISFLRADLSEIEKLLYLNEDLYNFLGSIAKWEFERKISFKETAPGEQMTNTFHKLTLEDNTVWYENKYYKM